MALKQWHRSTYVVTLLVWTALLGGLLLWAENSSQQVIVLIARNQALASINKDLNFIKWAGEHGGIYTRFLSSATKDTELAQQSLFHAITDSGTHLYRLLPVRALVSFYNARQQSDEIEVSLTSNHPLLKLNPPDQWEENAFSAISHTRRPFEEVTKHQNTEVFRYLHPLFVEGQCEACLAGEGLNQGDLLGGISVTIPLNTIAETLLNNRFTNRMTILFIWLIGLALISVGFSLSLNQINKQEASERAKELANAQLKQLSERLKQKNQAQKAFTYAISHDLQAPIRHVRQFSELLIKSVNEKKEAETINQLGQMLEGSTTNLNEIVQALLKLSRADSNELALVEKDLSALVSELVDVFKRSEPERNVDITIEPSLIDSFDYKLMKIALENILSNAWKYSSVQDVTRLEFSSHTENGKKVYCLSDNGIGFDNELAEEIFLPLKRLHNAGDFPGSGIGLSTVRRIIERHGGRIWASSIPGVGTKIYFTLS